MFNSSGSIVALLKNLKAWILIQLAAVLNISAGVLIAHKLAPEEFGKYSTVVAGITVMYSVLNPVINELSRLVAHHQFASRDLLKRITLGGICVCLGFATLVLISLKAQSLSEIAVVAVVTLLLVPSSWIQGVLTGKNRMTEHGMVQSLGALGRCVTLVFILMFSQSFSDALVSYACGFLLILLIGGSFIRTELHDEEEKIQLDWTVIIGFLLLSLPFSFDQILVQRAYQVMSGEYAGVMTYAKSVMLVAAPILTLAYGNVLQKKDSGDFARILQRTAVGVLFFSALIAGALWLLGPVLFPILLGPKYVTLTSLLAIPLAAIGMHVVSYSIFQAMLLRARKWMLFALLMPVCLQLYLLVAGDVGEVERLVNISLPVFGLQLVLAIFGAFTVVRTESR